MNRRGEGKTVALTLGSGGARGYAHIGAIEILCERGYEIVAISGCSMGALIGGVYATGKMNDYKDWVTGLGQFGLLKLLDVTFSSVGAIRGEKIFSVVREMIGDTRIEDLPIAYTAVATDLLGHREIWFQEGPLDQAIRASVAIPGVVTPLVLNGRVLVDGAVLNPLPIIPTISSHADLVVAVNVSGEDDRRNRIPDAAFESAAEGGREMDEWVNKLRGKASQWFDWDALKTFAADKRDKASGDATAALDKLGEAMKQKEAAAKKEAGKGSEKGLSEKEAEKGLSDKEFPDKEFPDKEFPDKKSPEKESPGKKSPGKKREDHETIDWDKLGIGKFDVMNLTIETMQSALAQYKLAGYPPDLLVNIPRNASRSYDYHRAPELIQLGRERMAAVLDRYERDMNSSGTMAL